MAGKMTQLWRVLSGEEEGRALTITKKVREAFMAGPTSAAGVNVNEKTALAVSAVYACTRVLAEGVATLPLHKYRRLDEGRLRLYDDPAIRLLTVAPNDYMTAYEWRELMMYYLCLRGNSFNRIQRSGDGQPAAIYPMHPDSMQIKFEDDGSVTYIWKPKNKERMRLPARDVIHIKALSSDGLVGLSPLDTLSEQVGYAYAMQQYGSRLFANDARPSGVLTHPGEIDDDAYERIAGSWNAAHSGKNQHSTAILEDGVKYDAIGLSPEHAQFLESKKLSRSEIAGAFRVPPHMIGDLDKATFSNIEKQDLFFAKHTLTPWCERIEQVLINRLIPTNKQGKEYYEHSLDGLLRGDIETRYKSYALLWDRGIINANEIRNKENMNPIEDGDKYYVPLNFIPTDETLALPSNADRSEPAQVVPQPKRACDCGECETRGTKEGKQDVNFTTAEDKQKIAEDRHDIIVAHYPLMASAMKRVLRREAQQLRKVFKKHLKRAAKMKRGDDDDDKTITFTITPGETIDGVTPVELGFEEPTDVSVVTIDPDTGDVIDIQQYKPTADFTIDVREVYVNTEYTVTTMREAFGTLGWVLGKDVEAEIGRQLSEEDNERLKEWTDAYIETFAEYHAKGQVAQILLLIDETKGDLYTALGEYLKAWQLDEEEGSRAWEIGVHEATRYAGAFSMFLISSQTREAAFVWRTIGDTCRTCRELHGKVVRYGEMFYKAQEAINIVSPSGESGIVPYKQDLRQPPAHKGCDCVITLQEGIDYQWED